MKQALALTLLVAGLFSVTAVHAESEQERRESHSVDRIHEGVQNGSLSKQQAHEMLRHDEHKYGATANNQGFNSHYNHSHPGWSNEHHHRHHHNH